MRFHYRKITITALCICAALLLGACGTAPVETTPPTETQLPTETIPVTEAPTEPQPEHFTLTFAGDCTLGSLVAHINYHWGFQKIVGEDYKYPFLSVIEYFENDDFSMVNLEGTFCEDGVPAVKKYCFRGPAKYVNILTENSVDAVTLANNHSMDFRQEGYDSTISTLEDAGVPYVEQDKSLIVTTESGLTLGIYAVSLDNLNEEEIVSAISELEANEEVELVILAAHWGTENSYRITDKQKTLAHAAIDAGADIVYGSHPHVLQPIEEYNGGIICYSLGNFCFGGNNDPKDYDTAVVQQEVIRDPDGTVRLGELTVIPCSISSVTNHNDFQPTPYPADSEEYERVMEKLSGTFRGGNLSIG